MVGDALSTMGDEIGDADGGSYVGDWHETCRCPYHLIHSPRFRSGTDSSLSGAARDEGGSHELGDAVSVMGDEIGDAAGAGGGIKRGCGTDIRFAHLTVAASTWAQSSTTKSTGTARFTGPTGTATRARGAKTRCMDTARTRGLTGTATRARFATTRSMGTAGTPGLTGPATRVRGMRRAEAHPVRYLSRASTRLKGRSAARVVQQERLTLLEG